MGETNRESKRGQPLQLETPLEHIAQVRYKTLDKVTSKDVRNIPIGLGLLRKCLILSLNKKVNINVIMYHKNLWKRNPV